MQCKLTIPELRVERGLTLEQLAEATGLFRAALGKYEADDFKDISPYSIVTSSTACPPTTSWADRTKKSLKYRA